MAAATKQKVFRPRGIEADGLKYYQELGKNGDYLCVDPSTADYYRQIGQPGMLEGRAAAIAGLASSVCTTGVSRDFLTRKCRRVRKANVPREWLRAMNGEEDAVGE